MSVRFFIIKNREKGNEIACFRNYKIKLWSGCFKKNRSRGRAVNIFI